MHRCATGAPMKSTMYGKMANTPMVARLLQQAQGPVNHSLVVRTAAAAAALCASVVRAVRPQDDPNDVCLSLSFNEPSGCGCASSQLLKLSHRNARPNPMPTSDLGRDKTNPACFERRQRLLTLRSTWGTLDAGCGVQTQAAGQEILRG